MIISLIGVCVFRVGWIYTVFQIPQYHTIESIYVSYPISWCLTIIAQLVLYLITLHSAKKKLLKNASTL